MRDKYLSFVQEQAQLMGKRFFLDSGEGRDWSSPEGDWYVEDLSGWLVDTEQASDFNALLELGGKEAAWKSDYQYCFVKWHPIDNPILEDVPIGVRFELVT